jgi:hypothetical protein
MAPHPPDKGPHERFAERAAGDVTNICLPITMSVVGGVSACEFRIEDF